MKKVLTLVAVAGMFAFYACGPSAEEKAAREKAVADSIRMVAEADSIAAAQQAAADAEKARQDSIAAAQQAAADSAAAKEAEGKKK
jgi:hypothetical protein